MIGVHYAVSLLNVQRTSAFYSVKYREQYNVQYTVQYISVIYNM